MDMDCIVPNMKRVEKAKTHIVYCDKCCEYGHSLPQKTNNLHASSYWTHKDCGGTIFVSETTTHEMLDDLSFDQKIALHQEISDKVEQITALCKKSDQTHLALVRSEIERRNRGSRNPLLPESVYKRSLLNNPTGVPYCPQCDSLLVQPIRAKKRLFSVGLFGMASDTVGKSMECLSCKYKW